MGMREDFEKWAKENGQDVSLHDNFPGCYSSGSTAYMWIGYKAATLQAAERMKEETEEAVTSLYEKDEPPFLPDITKAIHAIDVNKLFGE